MNLNKDIVCSEVPGRCVRVSETTTLVNEIDKGLELAK